MSVACPGTLLQMLSQCHPSTWAAIPRAHSAVGDGYRPALLGSISKMCDSALELKYSKMSHCSETRSNSDEVLKRGRGWAEGLCTSVS